MDIRTSKALEKTKFDIVIIGGGAHGSTAAYHLAKSGFKTAIIEQGDFCGGTSANSLKIIHGGLRYLQHGNVKRMRHSIRSRREMMQIAPHLTAPLACMMPTQGSGIQGKAAMRTALFLNDCISWDRNRELQQSQCLPRGHVVSKEKCLQVIPGMNASTVTGAAVWYDTIALDTERLLLEYVLESIEHGAVAANYCKAIHLERGDAGEYCLTVKDQLTGETCEVHTKGVVNAAGPWFERMTQSISQRPPKQKWALALNIVTKKQLFQNSAVALEGITEYKDKDALLKRGKRLYFFVPWREHTMIGTEYQLCAQSPEAVKIRRPLLEKMVDGVNSIYPEARLAYEDISFYHAGLMPAQDDSTEESIQLEKNSSYRHHADHGYENIVSILGVKYTTAPYIAWRLVEFFQAKVGKSTTESISGKTTIEKNNRPTHFEHLVKRYGRRASLVQTYIDSWDDNEVLTEENHGVLRGEVHYLVEQEMVRKLSDVVFRRTGIGTAEYPGRPLLYDIAECLAEPLEWGEDRIREEVEEVVDRYRPLII